jgi:hypothetical protein
VQPRSSSDGKVQEEAREDRQQQRTRIERRRLAESNRFNTEQIQSRRSSKRRKRIGGFCETGGFLDEGAEVRSVAVRLAPAESEVSWQRWDEKGKGGGQLWAVQRSGIGWQWW